MFLGNPGTGKTTVARLVAGIYRALGLLTKGHLVEVDRSELVAGYLGQTAVKTSEVVATALGGVLFVDEAYGLAEDQYGAEAVNTLVKDMEDHRDDLVVIVAGYPGPMATFLATNPGLESRFSTTVEFDDYTDAELREIFDRAARQGRLRADARVPRRGSRSSRRCRSATRASATAATPATCWTRRSPGTPGACGTLSNRRWTSCGCCSRRTWSRRTRRRRVRPRAGATRVATPPTTPTHIEESA